MGSKSSSSSQSSTYTPYNSYGGYGYGCSAPVYSAPVYSYVEDSDKSSNVYVADPVVTEYVYEDDCVEEEDPISYSISETTAGHGSSSESSDSSETYTYEESTDYTDDEPCGCRVRRSAWNGWN